MMRILLTGISGQVGNALRGPLSSIGEVLAADRSVIDLSRPAELFSVLDQLSPDLIINPAAYTAVDRAEEEQELAFRVNAEAPGALAQWAANRGVPIVHFSTDYVFDGSSDQPQRENHPTNPRSIYGASKLAGEAAIRGAGADHLIIRTSWVFAASGRNFLTTIAKLARERSELRIVADQIGAPTSARSIAEALISIIEDSVSNDLDLNLNSMKRKFALADGLVHISDRGETSWYGFATAIVAGLRSRGQELAVASISAIDSKDFPTSAARPLNSRLDMSRLKNIYGIEMPTWQQTLNNELDRFVLRAEHTP